jgi:hypothetical protein
MIRGRAHGFGGAGNDTLGVTNAANMVVKDFDPAQDRLEVIYSSAQPPVLALEQGDGAVIVRLDGVIALRLEGQTLASVKPGDIVFTRQAA